MTCLVVLSSFCIRKPFAYPQTILAGLGATEIEKATVAFCVGFFEANLADCDGIEDLSLNFSGSLLNDDTIKLLATCYNSANVVANQQTQFSPNNVTEITEKMTESLNMIKLDTQDE